MNKWLLFISLFLIIIAGITITVYSKARAPMINAQELAEVKAKAEAGLVTIEKFYLYNGSETYYVIIGKQADGNETVVWLPENEEQEVIIKHLNDGISEQSALNKLVSEENPQEILSIRLGMEKDLPIWELSYLDANAKLNYYYIHFDTGNWWRKIENL